MIGAGQLAANDTGILTRRIWEIWNKSDQSCSQMAAWLTLSDGRKKNKIDDLTSIFNANGKPMRLGGG